MTGKDLQYLEKYGASKNKCLRHGLFGDEGVRSEGWDDVGEVFWRLRNDLQRFESTKTEDIAFAFVVQGGAFTESGFMREGRCTGSDTNTWFLPASSKLFARFPRLLSALFLRSHNQQMSQSWAEWETINLLYMC